MKKNKSTGEQKIDVNAWMVTFSDLIMLMLTFFVLLLSMSSMDTKRLKNIFTHFTKATGVLEMTGTGDVAAFVDFVARYNDTEKLLVVDQNSLLEVLGVIKTPEIKDQELKDKLAELIRLTDDFRGIVLSFPDDIFFDLGKATLKAEILPVLDVIAEAIANSDNAILIVGHTDDLPIQGKLYASNWELSAYRGLSVLEYFIEEKNLPPSRFTVGGAGSAKPVHPNDSAKNRAANRRVEIVFKKL
jgi:chemotaxis protein MotB